MATVISHAKGGWNPTQGPYYLSVADSVDGLLYMPDPANAGKLIVAAGNVFCGTLANSAKIGDLVSLVVLGWMVVKCSGAIAANAAVTIDSAGKVKTGTVGTDHIIGFNGDYASTADGDLISVFKVA